MTPTTTTKDPGAHSDGSAPGIFNQNQTPMLSLAEQKKKEMEEEVCSLYTRTKKQNPEASYHKLTVMVASQTGLSPEGIKGILKRNGIKSTKNRN